MDSIFLLILTFVLEISLVKSSYFFIELFSSWRDFLFFFINQPLYLQGSSYIGVDNVKNAVKFVTRQINSFFSAHFIVLFFAEFQLIAFRYSTSLNVQKSSMNVGNCVWLISDALKRLEKRACIVLAALLINSKSEAVLPAYKFSNGYAPLLKVCF